MRYGLIVDGEAEYRALPLLIPRISTNATFVGPPLRVGVHGACPVGQIVGAVDSRLRILRAKRVERAIVLLDRESAAECAGGLATSIGRALASVAAREELVVEVVVKDRMLENWLVADARGLRRMRARFNIASGLARRITNDGADRVEALEILRSAALRDSYDKVADAVRIARQADVGLMGGASRSFRRFLRVAGCGEYSSQSARPL